MSSEHWMQNQVVAAGMYVPSADSCSKQDRSSVVETRDFPYPAYIGYPARTLNSMKRENKL